MNAMETSGWEIALAISTIVLALATIVLATAAVYAAQVAVKEVRLTRALADIDTRRRRAEASQESLRRFMDVYDRNHTTLLTAAREVTRKREERRKETDPPAQRCRIPDLLSEKFISTHQTGEPELNALQACLDALEEIGVGVELGVYDKYVLYHGAFSRIHQLVDWSRPFIQMSREGRIPHRQAQHTAFEQVLRLDDRFLEIQSAGAPARLAGALDEEVDSNEPSEDGAELAAGKKGRRQPKHGTRG